MDALEGAGYACQWRVLNALDYGLPQKRERTIIVGFAAPGAESHFAWPKPMAERKTLKDVLEANPHPRHSASKYIRQRRRRAHTAPLSPSIWHENKAGNISSHPFSCALRSGASYNYLLVNGERRLTPREQLRLQGFPDDFEVIGSDSQIRRQTGNAVPVPMVRAVIRSVLRAAAKHSRAPGRRSAASAAMKYIRRARVGTKRRLSPRWTQAASGRASITCAKLPQTRPLISPMAGREVSSASCASKSGSPFATSVSA